ncbi:MAG TPA: hypothetical protein VJA94_01340 [Candidatus Angelobacter sp.]
MWTEKLSAQVLRVVTPLGPRYIKPSSKERLYLLWMFRHFETLPEPVLSPRQQKLIDKLCTNGNSMFIPDAKRLKDLPLIGTVERGPKFHS